MSLRSLSCSLLLALMCACSSGSSDSSDNVSHATPASIDSVATPDTSGVTAPSTSHDMTSHDTTSHDTTSGADDTGGVRPDTFPARDGSADAAASVLVSYYAAINAHEYPHAYDAWSDNGRASKLTFDQFRSGFADTKHVVASVGTPGRIDAAAGSRYIEVPVTLHATYTTAKEKCFAGSYVLRRAVVTGATAAQMHWHIASATMHSTPCP